MPPAEAPTLDDGPPPGARQEGAHLQMPPPSALRQHPGPQHSPALLRAAASLRRGGPLNPNGPLERGAFQKNRDHFASSSEAPEASCLLCTRPAGMGSG